MLETDDSPAIAAPLVRILFVAWESTKSSVQSLTVALGPCLGHQAKLEFARVQDAPGAMSAPPNALVICFTRQDNTSGLGELLDAAEKRHIPLLILTDSNSAAQSQPNTWNSLPLGEPPQIIAAMLRGILSRQAEIDSLRKASLGAVKQSDQLLSEVQRMQDELHLAGQVQREFLPKKLPSFAGGSVAALWRPMNYVSGDIYDVRRLDEHHVGMFIADAVGHGVPAALLTMVIARGLPSKEITGNSYRIIQPSEALACVNRELLERQGNTMRFASAIYGIIDLRTRVMRCSIAGHPAAMVMRGNESIELLQSSGSLIGVFDGVTWSDREIQLNPGDRVVLYSDGFEFAFPDAPESIHSQGDLPPRHLRELGALLSMNEPAAMIEHMERRLDQQLLETRDAKAPADDLTMIVFKVS